MYLIRLLKQHIERVFTFLRRETLADLARSLPWGRQTTQEAGPTPSITTNRKRRESSADSGIKSLSSKSRRDSHHTAISDFRTEVVTFSYITVKQISRIFFLGGKALAKA